MKRIAILLLASVLLTTAGLHAGSDANLFLWNQANASMAAAQSPQDFAKAADIYRQIIDRGVHTSAVFYNYGTALLFAEAETGASDALLRAERLGGSSPDIRRNLELALRNEARAHAPVGTTATDASPVADSPLPWFRAPLFWHYLLSLPQRKVLLFFFVQVLWLALVLRLFRRLRGTSRGLLVLAVLGIVLFGTSVLVSIHQEAKPLPTPLYAWNTPEEVQP